MDANDSFEVEAKTIKEAAFAALSELGWGVAELPKEEDPKQLKLFKDE